MSAETAEVMRRADRLARLKAAGVGNPIQYVRSERETRAAIELREARRARIQRERDERLAEARPPGGVVRHLRVEPERVDVDAEDPRQPWVPRASPRDRGSMAG